MNRLVWMVLWASLLIVNRDRMAKAGEGFEALVGRQGRVATIAWARQDLRPRGRVIRFAVDVRPGYGRSSERGHGQQRSGFESLCRALERSAARRRSLPTQKT